MNIRVFLALALTLLAATACVVEPIGGRGYYGGGHGYDRGNYSHEYGRGDYGRGVWRG